MITVREAGKTLTRLYAGGAPSIVPCSGLRALVAAAGLAAVAVVLMPQAAAQAQWPVKPMRIVVPVVPGSFTDVVARGLAADMGESLGQSVLVENRAGAGTTIGAATVAKSTPDGYTLLMTENSFSIAPALYGKQMTYDPVRDFQPVTLIAEAPTVWFSRLEFPARSPKDLVQLARKRKWAQLLKGFKAALAKVDTQEPASMDQDGAPREAKKSRKGSSVTLSTTMRQQRKHFATELEGAEAMATAAEAGFAFAFEEGALVKAVRAGWWLLIDEINLAPPEVSSPQFF